MVNKHARETAIALSQSSLLDQASLEKLCLDDFLQSRQPTVCVQCFMHPLQTAEFCVLDFMSCNLYKRRWNLLVLSHFTASWSFQSGQKNLRADLHQIYNSKRASKTTTPKKIKKIYSFCMWFSQTWTGPTICQTG